MENSISWLTYPSAQTENKINGLRYCTAKCLDVRQCILP